MQRSLRRGFLCVETHFTVRQYRYQHTKHAKDVCQFIAYCVAESETVFRGLIICASSAFTTNSAKIPVKFKCFTVSKTVQVEEFWQNRRMYIGRAP